jgi:hypothetical protein
MVLQPFDQPSTAAWDEAHPWNRQPCDHGDRWPLFRAYLSDGPTRTVARLAERFSLAPNILHQYAREGFWLERAKAYDVMIHEQYNATVVEHIIVEAKDQAEKHLRMIDNALEIASIEFERLLNETRERSMSGTMKHRDLIRLVESMLKLRLLFTGEATERVEIKDIETILQALPIEQVEALQLLQEKLICGKSNDGQE